jgi:diguanylate cyclase (GGDEF)-like protein
MMAQSDTLGVLHLIPAAGQGEDRTRSIPVPLQNLAKAAADQIALALSNIRFREVLQSQSIRDPLTTLFNRRYMEESLQRELHHAKRMGTTVAVIMLDIDYFKGFNDMHGHRTADNMLRLFGAFLQKAVRLDDIVCRYGGEEFVLILPATGLEDAMKRIDQAREGSRNLSVETELGTTGHLTFSAGIALFPIHGMDSDALLSAADRALYYAKHTGRDRVSVAVEV